MSKEARAVALVAVANRQCPACGELCDDPDWLSCHECGEPLNRGGDHAGTEET